MDQPCIPTPSSADPPPDPSHVLPGGLSSLCAKGWRPLLLTGLIRDLLIRHFADAGNIEESDLRQFIWHDGDVTGILIESIFRWVGTLVEKRPALIIKRNAYQNMRLGVGDFQGIDRDGQAAFCTTWVGSHTIFCIHGTGAGAEILATETVRELHQFHPVITAYLGLLRYGVTEVGAPATVEEAHQNFVVPVTVGWAYQDNWRVELESMKLRRITLSALLDLG